MFNIFGKNKKKKKKYEKDFLKYGGCVSELDLFATADGMFYRVYRPDLPLDQYDADKIHKMLRPIDGECRLQFVISDDRVYELIGIEADDVYDANEKFDLMESVNFPADRVSCLNWSEMMAYRTIFAERPSVKKKMIDSLQPYNLTRKQKTLEISGKTAKTLLLIGYPSKVFAGFTTELMKLSPRLTLSIHAQELDAQTCLDGLNSTDMIRPARREMMKRFLTETMEKEGHIYNTCALISLVGLPGEIEDDYKKLSEYCKKYLINLSELDYQQGIAFASTLPMLQNYIRYNRVMTADNLEALLPWSALGESEKTVCYGSDAIVGKVFYDRRVLNESGFIVSSDPNWARSQMINEIKRYQETGSESISIVSVGDPELPGLTDLEKPKKTAIDYNKRADFWLYETAVMRWAIDRFSTNGKTMRKHIEAVRNASDVASFRSDKKDMSDKERMAGYLDRFLSTFNDNDRRVLTSSEFPHIFRITIRETNYGKVYQIPADLKESERQMAYALMVHSLKVGIVYSLNTECFAWYLSSFFKPNTDVLYTFLTKDNYTLYESDRFAEIYNECPFLLAGEHKTAEKLRLCSVTGMTKDERAWISEPARGAVFVSQLVNYMLLDDSQKGEQ
jgi:hypothetical protein